MREISAVHVATEAASNGPAEVAAAVARLLDEALAQRDRATVISLLLATGPGIDAAFPAAAARAWGLEAVPIMGLAGADAGAPLRVEALVHLRAGS